MSLYYPDSTYHRLADNPNQAARRIIMSAFLYYSCGTSVLSDDEYDELSLKVIEDWDKLEPIYKWQLGSKEELTSTGYHIKVTWYSVAGALHWHEINKGSRPVILNRSNIETSEEFKCQWFCVG